jgi:hypothetical protein
MYLILWTVRVPVFCLPTPGQSGRGGESNWEEKLADSDRSGRTPEELQTYRQSLQKQYEAMRSRLEAAREQPQQWSGYLRWSGVGLAAVGCLVFLSQGK